MGERDISPRAGGPAGSDRDPTALAAWRRVAEQRRRRQVEPGEPGESGEPSTAPAPAGPARRAPGREPEATASRTPAREDGGGAGSRHDLLLALAGRLDDDALSTVRELVAVDDAAAAEMLGGCLLADRVAVTDAERAHLDRWFSGARVDPELLGALPTDPDAADRARHRFVADLPGVPTDDGEAVARAAARLSGVTRVRQCWRVTPAGAGPGPLPHRVVLVEAESADDCEHVAHHAVHAARSRGPVSVEVYARGAELPAYQRDAVAAAGSGEAVASAAGADPSPGAAPALSVRRRPGAEVARFTSSLGGDRAEPREADEVAGVTGVEIGTGFGALIAGPRDEVEEVGGVDGLDEAGELLDAEDPEDRRDTGGWRVVADSDRGATSDGWSMPASVGEDDLSAAETGADAQPDDGHGSIADLDPDAAAARIAALWREPSPVDAFDVPLTGDGWSPNLLEPDLPEPDLAHEMARYDAPRPATGSFGRVDVGDAPAGTDADEGRDAGEVDREAPTGAHARPGPAPDALDGAGPDPWSGGRIRRARHSRAAADDDEPGPVPDHDVRFGAGADAPWRSGADVTSPVDLDEPATTTPTATPAAAATPPADGAVTDGYAAGPPAARPEPPTGPVSVTPTASSPPSSSPPSAPVPSSPETEEAMSQLSDRERDLLSRLHAELAARERLESGEPDPFAGRGADPAPPPSPSPSPRPSPGPRPSPAPRRPAGDDPDAVTQGGPLPGRVNGHAHGAVNGHAHGAVNGHAPGQNNGHGHRNGHALPPEGPDDDAR